MGEPDYGKIIWSDIPVRPESVVAVIIMRTIDHGPWWKRIWRGKWRRFEGQSYRVPRNEIPPWTTEKRG